MNFLLNTIAMGLTVVSIFSANHRSQATEVSSNIVIKQQAVQILS
jgi:hypothetical protein